MMNKHQEKDKKKEIYYLNNNAFNQNKKNILLQVHINTHFKDMLRVAKLFKFTNEYNPILFFTSNYEYLSNHLEILDEYHIDYVKFFEMGIVKLSALKLFKFNWRLNIKWKVSYKFHNQFSLPKKIRLNIRFVKLKQLKKRLVKHLSIIKSIIKVSRYCLALAKFNSIKRLITNNITLFFSKLKTPPLTWNKIRNQIINSFKQVIELCYKKTISFFLMSIFIILIEPFIRITVLFNFKPVQDQIKALILKVFRYLWNNNSNVLIGLFTVGKTYHEFFPIILDNLQIKLLIIPEHNLFYFTQLSVYLAKQKNIPSILVPFTIANTLEWAESFYDAPERNLKNKYNKLLGQLFPEWTYTHKNKKLILPHELIFIHEMLTIRPPNPWLLNSGDINFIAVESVAMQEYYMKAGINGLLFRTIGALYDDELFNILINKENNKKILCEQIQINNQLPILLCALPPNQFSSRSNYVEFSSYEEIVCKMVEELSHYQEHYNLLINLHPRTHPDSVKWLKNYPVTIVNQDIVELIPLASIYVASCSATIRMAISCGVPVINYDVYRYHYDDYTGTEGVLTVFDLPDYQRIIKKLITSNDYLKKTTSLQKQTSRKWGNLDGKNGLRLLREIDLLLAL